MFMLCIAAWNDTRTTPTLNRILTKIRHKKNYLKSICGLPFSNCFSAIKIKWLMDNIDGIKATIRDRKCFFGTLDTWILWNLTGGLDDGVHITDVTNASRTMLMSLEQLQWDSSLCTFFQIPAFILPTIKSSAEKYGYVCDGPLKGIPIMAVIKYNEIKYVSFPSQNV
jgi:glycerol kinase